jgi:hypothetical protein
MDRKDLLPNILIDVADLPVVRVGRAIRVPTARFLKWVEEFEKQRLSA